MQGESKFYERLYMTDATYGLSHYDVTRLSCAAWMDGIAFLFGDQPLGSEVGTESVTYGFWPEVLQERLKKNDLSGHIRDFTPRSLWYLTTHCGFTHAGW
ncbi:MAG: hypothetical protein WCO56_02265 [Verrucomicrobiota bacterium]